MGLDITAYKNLREVPNAERDEEGNPTDCDLFYGGKSMQWSEENFHGRGEGVDPNKIYSYDDSFEFYAGSYFGYNHWRKLLSSFRKGSSFSELIDFADNEGVIGSIVSKKLYNDFRQNEEYMEICALNLQDNGLWKSLYSKWMAAFEMAKDNGAVKFH
ncbi:MAG: hypothetical protein RR365_08630 [Bacteroides sp.]